jgi:diaminohydroxyphosphoribosylaminopyrimidine deaminase/5-amino-6-(5-phosphoribosylamino)uracil reductase
MDAHSVFMQRCLELAEKGRGYVAPNPMVGCVVVYRNEIIGEGWHAAYGQAHAEVKAIASVADQSLLTKATLYVNLEPCAHFGKTPPCADLILLHKIPYVVIGCQDSFSQVNGKGIAKLIQGGTDVKTGVLEAQCREFNKRFFTFQEQKRPYIVLKWAQTADGFIDHIRQPEQDIPALQISSAPSQQLVHLWRAQEQAILVGTNTALLDNPKLTVRFGEGRNPLRIALDQSNRIPPGHHLKDGSSPTLIFTAQDLANSADLKYVKLNFNTPAGTLKNLLEELYKLNIQSVLVEGGAALLQSFLNSQCWDEARVFESVQNIGAGVPAPTRPQTASTSTRSGTDTLSIYTNNPVLQKRAAML